MVVVSMLPHAEIGRNDYREGAPRFISCWAHELLSGNRESFAKLHLRAVYFNLSKSLGVKISALKLKIRIEFQTDDRPKYQF